MSSRIVRIVGQRAIELAEILGIGLMRTDESGESREVSIDEALAMKDPSSVWCEIGVDDGERDGDQPSPPARVDDRPMVTHQCLRCPRTYEAMVAVAIEIDGELVTVCPECATSIMMADLESAEAGEPDPRREVLESVLAEILAKEKLH